MTKTKLTPEMQVDGKKEAVKRKKRSQLSEIWRRLRRNRLAMLGLFIVILLILAAVFADQIADYDTDVVKQNVAIRFEGPSAEHWCGTDELGRDIFARLVHGARISLLVGVVAVIIALATGGVLGAIAGYFGGKLDNLIMRIMDIFLSIPILLLAIMIVDEHDESDDCHRPCQYADLCQSRPGLGFKRQGSGIRGGSQGYRREKFPYYRPPHCAQLSFTDHCPGDAPCGNGYPLHGVLKLHRPRH